jgi:uncharacterized protein YbcI
MSEQIGGVPLGHGHVCNAISNGMAALQKEFYGLGPLGAKTYYEDDLVACVLRGGFTRAEETLLEGGRGAAVVQQRLEFQELMRERFTDVVERLTGRAVIAFMSAIHQHPAMICELFILAPIGLLDEHESPAPPVV